MMFMTTMMIVIILMMIVMMLVMISIVLLLFVVTGHRRGCGGGSYGCGPPRVRLVRGPARGKHRIGCLGRPQEKYHQAAVHGDVREVHQHLRVRDKQNQHIRGGV